MSHRLYIILALLFIEFLLSFFIFDCAEGSADECGDWTVWFDTDNPESGLGDEELVSDILTNYRHRMCHSPTSVEAKTIGDGKPATETGEIIAFNSTGIVCENEVQPDKMCFDYQIRACCPTPDDEVFLDSLCGSFINITSVTASSNENAVNPYGGFVLRSQSAENYANDFDCSLTIYPSDPGKRILLSFLSFGVEESHSDFCFDKLQIYSKLSLKDDLSPLTPISGLCGTSPPSDYLGNYEMKLIFQTDSNAIETGFKALVTEFSKGICCNSSEEFLCPNDRCIDVDLSIQKYDFCGDEENYISLEREESNAGLIKIGAIYLSTGVLVAVCVVFAAVVASSLAGFYVCFKKKPNNRVVPMEILSAGSMTSLNNLEAEPSTHSLNLEEDQPENTIIGIPPHFATRFSSVFTTTQQHARTSAESK